MEFGEEIFRNRCGEKLSNKVSWESRKTSLEKLAPAPEGIQLGLHLAQKKRNKILTSLEFGLSVIISLWPCVIIPLLQSTFFFFQWPFTIHITHLHCVEVLEKQARKFNYHWWWGSGQDEKGQARVQNDKASLGLGPPSFLLSVLPTATFLQVTLIFSCHVTTKRLELPNNGEILFRYATRCGPSSITQDCCRKFNFLLHRGSVHFLWRLD